MNETVKIDKKALLFVDPNAFSSVNSGTGDNSTPTLDMVCYSGGVIKDHWWWGDLAIDLQGMSFKKAKFPILEDHNTSKKIGFATKMSIEGNKLTVAESSFINSPESQAFQQNSIDGFPYEASWYGIPTVIEQLSEGETAEVNGYTFKGPGTIWRKTIFKEASVCTFGYDPNTKSVASMSEPEELQIEYIGTGKNKTQFSKKEDLSSMDAITKFKTENPEQYQQLVESITSSVETKFSEEKGKLETQLTAANDQNIKLSKEVESLSTRVVSLEKDMTIRSEKDLRFTAEAIIKEEMGKAGVSERLFSKIVKMVNYGKHVKDGTLDKESFSAAIAEELKDWIVDESASDAPIQGFSTSTKSFHSKENLSVDSTVDRMLGHLGQKKSDK